MSTPNPTHINIIADAVDEHDYSITHIGRCVLCDVKVDDMATHRAEHVVSKLTDAGYSIVQRGALARAMYLDQARRHVHPADELSPEKMWDGNFFSRKDLWLAEADRILAAAAEGEKP